MSDSEYEVLRAASSKAKSKQRQSVIYDSEFEALAKADSKQKRKAPIRSDSDTESTVQAKLNVSDTKRKRKASLGSNTAKKRNGKKDFDVFGLLSNEEAVLASESASRQSGGSQRLTSSISSRVANGSVVRSTSLDGDSYVEVRVYSAREAIDTRPELRYTKALVTLKLQLDSEQPEWEQLQRFLRTAKTRYFAEKKPIFYAEKK